MSTAIPDIPLEKGSSSSLGLDPSARALASFIEACDTPLPIGIQGDWGSGKTSLMNLIDERLTGGGRRPRCASVWFNTWQYSQFANSDRLGVSLLTSLVHQIRDLPMTEGWPPPDVRVKMRRFAIGVARATTVVAGAVVGARMTGIAVEGSKLVEAFEDREAAPDEARLFEKLSVDFAAIVASTLEEMKTKRKIGIEKLVVYIDDLDRLPPVRAIELLEVIKNFVDVPGCVFVLAIDYDVILRGLRTRKGLEGDKLERTEGKSFFDKIIQVPFRMPTTSYQSERFLEEQYLALHGNEKAWTSFLHENSRALIESSVGNNPRSMKRLLNLHSLLVHLTKETRAEQGGRRTLRYEEMAQLLVLTAIQMAWFPLYRALARARHDADLTLIAFMLLERIETLYVEAGEPLDSAAGDDVRLLSRAREIKLKGSKSPLAAAVAGREDRFAQAVAEVADTIAAMKQQGRLSDRARRHIPVLARLFYRAVDLNGNGKFDEDERKSLSRVLRLAASTSIEEADSTEEPSRRRTRQATFRRLLEPPGEGLEPLMGRGDRLVFDDRRVTPGRFVVEPDWDSPRVRLQVQGEGGSVSLTEKTNEILRLIEEEGAELSATERARKFWASIYWSVQRGESVVPLLDILDRWRDAGAAEE